MTPNLASIGMCCSLRLCWSNRTKLVSVPHSPYCYFSNESACLDRSPPIDKMTLYILAMLAHSNSYMEGHTLRAINMPGRVRNHPGISESFHKATAGWYVGRTSVCPCLHFSCSGTSPKYVWLRVCVVWVWSTFLLWGKLMTQSPLPHNSQCTWLQSFHTLMKPERQKKN